MNIKFLGAARTVTGSQHLITINNKKILFDCGLFQGRREYAYDINKEFMSFKPKEVDYLVLSHAHIDHSGNIPQLIKKGYENKIFATPATRDLCEIMLKDSGHIQEKNIEDINKKKKKENLPLFKPLYTESDAQDCMQYFQEVPYHQEVNITSDISFEYYDAGHILGSAMIYLKYKNNGSSKSICFSGDLGRPNLAIIKDPEVIPTPNYLILESTYGGRFHTSAEDTENELGKVINVTVDRKGKIIIPAFSVGRTQELIYFLHNLFEKKKIPRLPIFIDSPLSVNITDVFRKHSECFDDETKSYIQNSEDPFSFNSVRYIKSKEESKALNDYKGSCIIISASGMCEVGRILYHLKNNVENPNNTILIVGYNAEHTLGRKIVEREKYLNILGETYQLKADVKVMNSLSAHADSNEIINYMKKLDTKKLEKIFLVHGDYDQQQKLKARLNEIGYENIFIPEKEDSFELD